ncbi:conserved hypothetical protein [Rhodobacteraceae bacterium KLH11]|nr:conserved hypothetical protein [Rhodobacteraceae bacterium KLH11]
MGFLRHIIGLIAALLVTALSAVAMPLAPITSHQAKFFPHHNTEIAEHTDVHFAARAPPTAVTNVAIAGDFFVMHGSAFVLHGNETHVASLDFSADFVATNKTATQADVSDHFQQNRKFWTQDPIQYNGNKVYQRNDLIDPTKVDPKTGKTNLELMQAGRAPLGPDGKPVNLHHLTQKQDGAIAEVTQTLHKDNHATLHMPNTVPSGIDRTQFNKWRRDYWKNRANDF